MIDCNTVLNGSNDVGYSIKPNTPLIRIVCTSLISALSAATVCGPIDTIDSSFWIASAGTIAYGGALLLLLTIRSVGNNSAQLLSLSCCSKRLMRVSDVSSIHDF